MVEGVTESREAEDVLVSAIRRGFELPDNAPSQYSPLALAYIGDNVYELVNRTVAVGRANRQVLKLHRECSNRAKAGTQAQLIAAIEDDLTEEEHAVYLRGRNAYVNTKAKNATTSEYHHATGLEAVIGYLYLSGRYERIVDLLKSGWEKLNV